MSISLTDANFDKVLHLETYNQMRYKHLKFVSLLDPQTAVELGFDAPAAHQQNYPSLPPGIPNNWKAYKYAKFYDATNNAVFLGVPWVRESSIVEDESSPYLITVWGVDQTTIDSVRSMLTANGIVDFEIERK